MGENVGSGFGWDGGDREGEVGAFGDGEEPLVGVLDDGVDHLPRHFGLGAVGFDGDACFGEGERRGLVAHAAIDTQAAIADGEIKGDDDHRTNNPHTRKKANHPRIDPKPHHHNAPKPNEPKRDQPNIAKAPPPIRPGRRANQRLGIRDLHNVLTHLPLFH